MTVYGLWRSIQYNQETIFGVHCGGRLSVIGHSLVGQKDMHLIIIGKLEGFNNMKD